MTEFAGLYSYEVVLMLLGITLFLALLIALLRNVFKDKPFAKLLPAFLISIVMVGYPSIQSIQYGDAIVQIQAANSELERNPANQQAQSTLRELAPKVESRATGDPEGKAALQAARSFLAGRAVAGANLSGSSSHGSFVNSKTALAHEPPHPTSHASKIH